MSSFWSNPAVVGLILAIPSSIFAYLAYRRSHRVDEVAKQAGQATEHGMSIDRVIAGMNTVIVNVQKDNEDLRKDVDRLEQRLDLVETGNAALIAKNLELERENRVLHAENEALKIESAENKTEIATLKARIEKLEKVNGPPEV